MSNKYIVNWLAEYRTTVSNDCVSHNINLDHENDVDHCTLHHYEISNLVRTTNVWNTVHNLRSVNRKRGQITIVSRTKQNGV